MNVDMLLARFLLTVFLFCSRICATITEEECISPLGMESGDISRDQITASSRDCTGDCGLTSFGRLHSNDSWYPDNFETPGRDQWIQIDLLEVKNVAGIQTQGHQRSNTTYFVRSFKLQSSNKETDDWTTYSNSTFPKEDAIFDGNVDADTVRENLLDQPILARYIRVIPWSWSPNGVSLRLELLGCEQDHTVDTTTVTTTKVTQTVAIATEMTTHVYRSTVVPVTSNTSGQGANETSPWPLPTEQTEKPGSTPSSFPIGAVIGGTIGGVLGLILLIVVAVVLAKRRLNTQEYPVFTNPIYNKTTRPLDSNRNQPRSAQGSQEEMEEFVVNHTYRGPRPGSVSEPLKTTNADSSES
ncbi:uncharacterized protein LOC144876116 isoform X1 [Branchiostoma floridae x Branchiostoma japonicum]